MWKGSNQVRFSLVDPVLLRREGAKQSPLENFIKWSRTTGVGLPVDT